jgi:DNA polymerase-1
MRLALLDGHGIIFRAYFAQKDNPLSVRRTGEVTTAVFGFANTLLRVIGDLKPTHIAVTLDKATPTFRHERDAAYKAHRPDAPDDLVPQFARVRELIQAFNIPIYEADRFEADDCLGTLGRQAAAQGVETYLVTLDSDIVQLVQPNVKVYMYRPYQRDVVIYETVEQVKDRYGVRPDQIADLKGLKGDASDNIPGVPGIGEKTAIKLLTTFDHVENIYEYLWQVTPPKLQEALRTNEAQARHSKGMATIVTDCPISLDLDECRVGDYDRERVVQLFQELEFRSLVPRLPEVEAALRPEARPEVREALEAEQPAYHTVTDLTALDTLVQRIRAAGHVALDTETTSQSAMQARLVGISLAVKPYEACYIPVGHGAPSEPLPPAPSPPAVPAERGRRRARAGDAAQLALAQSAPLESSTADEATPLSAGAAGGEGPGEGPPQLPMEVVLDRLRPVLEDPSIRKVGHNAKYDMIVLANAGVNVRGLDFDTMVAAYLLGEGSLGLKPLAFDRLGVEMTPITDLIGTGRKQISMAEVAIERASTYAAADADMTLRLRGIFEGELREKGLWELFDAIEVPLVTVLTSMERRGVSLDTDVLREMSMYLNQEIEQAERATHEAAGQEFKINSPAQLSTVLFEKLGLPKTRKTATGYSTDAQALEWLRSLHPIINLLDRYRELTKLKSTYVDALPGMINPATGRIHTTYNQTRAATGRLSSENPNLQNIPIRTELGRRVRRAFVAREPASPPLPHRGGGGRGEGADGWLFVSADYSQVELRILAHISKEPFLLEAFRLDEDIHRATAGQLFGVELKDVTYEQRQLAKTINFAVLYGLSAQGLSQRTEMSRGDSAEFIRTYFERYPLVKRYLDTTIAETKRDGYASTLLGRRRYLPDINSSNFNLRQAAERMATNHPIQGTNADIIKIAMNQIEPEIERRGLRGHMILQVHDELVFECPENEADAICRLALEIMPAAMQLDVPLKVEVKAGRNWGDMEPRGEAVGSRQ